MRSQRIPVTGEVVLPPASDDDMCGVEETEGTNDKKTRTVGTICRRNKVTASLVTCAIHMISLGTALITSGNRRKESTTTSPSDRAGSSNVPKGDNGSARFNQMFNWILYWNVTPRAVLENETSARYKALPWITTQENGDSDNVQTLLTRYALATFYFSTDASWKVGSHWMSSYPVCLWHGIDCCVTDNTVEMVKEFNLTANGLQGTIPPEIALLQRDLRLLDLSIHIPGTIPDLSPLEHLQQLDLGPNQIS
jgi:hypothetical protein